MPNSEIESRLLKSDAFQSLSAEQHLASILSEHDWFATHSCFYTDWKTGKVREIDVIGSQRWSKKDDEFEVRAALQLFFEVKAASGYHLLFSPTTPPSKADKAHYDWIGSNIGWRYETEEVRKEDEIIQALGEAGVSEEQVQDILTEFHKIAYPDEFILPYEFIIDPPIAPVYASAYRETNVGAEKTLSNSVLWRASRVLESAIVSMAGQYFEGILSDLKSAAEYASLKDKDPIDEALRVLAYRSAQVDIRHPIVVIDADLWVNDGGSLNAIDWCRFIQLEHHGYAFTWFDIVNSNYVEDFISETTRHYRKAFAECGASRKSDAPEPFER